MTDDAPSDGAAAARPARSELTLRIVSGAVLAAVAVGLALLGGLPFALLWTAAAIAVGREWLAVSGTEPRSRLALVIAVGLALMALDAAAGGPRATEFAIGCATVGLLLLLARSGRDRAWAVCGFAYAAVVALVPIRARALPDLGTLAILWTFAVVWTTDVAAFFVGRTLGGPKLMPRVSPKKTWSGFLGGLAAGAAAGYAVTAAAGPQGILVPWSAPLILVGSAVASVASQIGDLAESAMKRHFGVKDSGSLIPGHGGVMDRLDGFAAVLVLVGLALAGAAWAEG